MSFRIIWRKFATIANLATNQELTLLENVKASSGSDVDDVDGLCQKWGKPSYRAKHTVFAGYYSRFMKIRVYNFILQIEYDHMTSCTKLPIVYAILMFLWLPVSFDMFLPMNFLLSLSFPTGFTVAPRILIIHANNIKQPCFCVDFPLHQSILIHNPLLHSSDIHP